MIPFVVVKVNSFFDKFMQVFEGFRVHRINAFLDRAVHTLDLGVLVRAMRMDEPMIDSRFGNDAMKFVTDKGTPVEIVEKPVYSLIFLFCQI